MLTVERLIAYGLVFLVCSFGGVLILRREYRLRGKLSRWGSLVHVGVFAVNGMFIGLLLYGEAGIPPMGSLGPVGVALMSLGFGIVLYAWDLFRTFSRWLGSDTPGLATHGLYRWSRNPQFVGYGLSILGACLAWWNGLAWVGLLSYMALAYAVTRVEEEHLKRTYGASYEAYCQRVPRYLGLPKG
jgi:protein-S-isoprenylcysteine O-methyltransferase Ste14